MGLYGYRLHVDIALEMAKSGYWVERKLNCGFLFPPIEKFHCRDVAVEKSCI